MLVDACRGEIPGTRVAYRTGDHLNQRRTHFQSRIFPTTGHELLFTDDCAPNASTEGDMQRSMDLFTAARDKFVSVTSTEKRVIVHQPQPDAAFAHSKST
ncbi:hypothetical protein SprV_0301075200 [Sparganum proliferum]